MLPFFLAVADGQSLPLIPLCYFTTWAKDFDRKGPKQVVEVLSHLPGQALNLV
jgi:hypothetical protein